MLSGKGGNPQINAFDFEGEEDYFFDLLLLTLFERYLVPD